MIPALLAQIGLPVLVKVVGKALGKIDKPVAKIAEKALNAVDKAVMENEISFEEIAEANRHTEKMAEIDGQVSVETIRQINETFRYETKSEDAYVRRWRPTFGYAVALAWVGIMGAVSYIVVTEPSLAPAVIAALVSTSPIWGVALGVLGVSVVKRSQDKAVLKEVSSTSGKGLFSEVRKALEKNN